MLAGKFDNGWGIEWPLKQLEQEIVDNYLRPWLFSDRKIVVINSTWYTNEYHAHVLTQLDSVQPDHVVLVSMLDAAIPHKHWFSYPATGIGYYSGDHYIDFWAVMVSKYFETYSDDFSNIHIPYMCLNRKPHWHRRQLYQQLVAEQIVEQGIVSMGGDNQHPAKRLLPTEQLGCNLAPNPGTEHHGIPNDIASLGNIDNWRSHFLNIVTETVYDINKNHFVSEKIFKPIVGLRPFLVYDSDGATKWLADRNFESYVGDFRDITNLDLSRPENIAPFLKTLVEQPQSYFYKKTVALKEKILYNKNQFEVYVKQQSNKILQGIPCQI